MSFEISKFVSTFSAGEKTDGKETASADDDSELPTEYLNSALSKEAQVRINYNHCKTFSLHIFIQEAWELHCYEILSAKFFIR